LPEPTAKELESEKGTKSKLKLTNPITRKVTLHFFLCCIFCHFSKQIFVGGVRKIGFFFSSDFSLTKPASVKKQALKIARREDIIFHEQRRPHFGKHSMLIQHTEMPFDASHFVRMGCSVRMLLRCFCLFFSFLFRSVVHSVSRTAMALAGEESTFVRLCPLK
jgi:hypothetical protein